MYPFELPTPGDEHWCPPTNAGFQTETLPDINILVCFDGPATAKRYFGVQFYIEGLLGRPVDLVTDKALRPELRPYVEAEAIHV